MFCAIISPPPLNLWHSRTSVSYSFCTYQPTSRSSGGLKLGIFVQFQRVLFGKSTQSNKQLCSVYFAQLSYRHRSHNNFRVILCRAEQNNLVYLVWSAHKPTVSSIVSSCVAAFPVIKCDMIRLTPFSEARDVIGLIPRLFSSAPQASTYACYKFEFVLIQSLWLSFAWSPWMTNDIHTKRSIQVDFTSTCG